MHQNGDGSIAISSITNGNSGRSSRRVASRTPEIFFGFFFFVFLFLFIILILIFFRFTLHVKTTMRQ